MTVRSVIQLIDLFQCISTAALYAKTKFAGNRSLLTKCSRYNSRWPPLPVFSGSAPGCFNKRQVVLFSDKFSTESRRALIILFSFHSLVTVAILLMTKFLTAIEM